MEFQHTLIYTVYHHFIKIDNASVYFFLGGVINCFQHNILLSQHPYDAGIIIPL